MKESVKLVDIHNHLIPGVDDGARDLEQSLRALAAMHAQGVRRLVATPHLDADLIGREEAFAKRMEAIDAAWESLRVAAAEHFPDVELARGHEIMLDVPWVTLQDPRVRLAGTASVLVEFPRLFVPKGSTEVLHRLRMEGWYPIIAHPERYVNLESGDLSLIEEWRNVGARMAVNAGSVLGGFGSAAQRVTHELLRQGWIDIIGSDFHARSSRPLVLREAYDRLVSWEGEAQAEMLLSVNPGLAMDGEELKAVPPLALPRGLWGRMRSIFSRAI